MAAEGSGLDRQNKIDMFDQLHLLKCQVDAQLIAFWDKHVAESEKKG